jgi:hypothetical protein
MMLKIFDPLKTNFHFAQSFIVLFGQVIRNLFLLTM